MRKHTCKVTVVPGLGIFDGFRPENDLHASGNATPGKLGLDLLNPDLLEVDKARLVDVQDESGAIVAYGIPANSGLGVLELLLHVFDDGLAVHAGEGARHQFRVDGVGADDLAGDAEQVADFLGGEITNFVDGVHVGEGDQVILVERDLCPLADKGLEGGAQKRVEAVVFRSDQLSEVRIEAIHVLGNK